MRQFKIIKRSGEEKDFDITKIENAIRAALHGRPRENYGPRFVIIMCTRSKKMTCSDMARSSNTVHRGKIGACATCHESLKPNT